MSNNSRILYMLSSKHTPNIYIGVAVGPIEKTQLFHSNKYQRYKGDKKRKQLYFDFIQYEDCEYKIIARGEDCNLHYVRIISPSLCKRGGCVITKMCPQNNIIYTAPE